MTSSFNYTFIALISKKNNSLSVIDFKPISLYNIIYKLVSKVIINKLKPLMNSIISSSQSAFIPGRIIKQHPSCSQTPPLYEV